MTEPGDETALRDAQRLAIARRRRVLASEKFVAQLRESLVDLPLYDEPAPRPTPPTQPAHDAAFDGEMRHRIAMLRATAEARPALPARVARLPFARLPFVRRLLLKLANYFAGPSRRQATLVADCLDLLVDELRRARGGR